MFHFVAQMKVLLMPYRYAVYSTHCYGYQRCIWYRTINRLDNWSTAMLRHFTLTDRYWVDIVPQSSFCMINCFFIVNQVFHHAVYVRIAMVRKFDQCLIITFPNPYNTLTETLWLHIFYDKPYPRLLNSFEIWQICLWPNRFYSLWEWTGSQWSRSSKDCRRKYVNFVSNASAANE